MFPVTSALLIRYAARGAVTLTVVLLPGDKEEGLTRIAGLAGAFDTLGRARSAAFDRWNCRLVVRKGRRGWLWQGVCRGFLFWI
jgi:hypothetical protein